MNTDNNAPTDKAAEPEVPQNLEQIARDIPVEEQARTFTAQPQPAYQSQYAAPNMAPQVPQPYVPDPISDQDGYRRWVIQQHQTNEQLQGVLKEVVGKVRAHEELQQQAKIDSEVNDTVSKVNANLNLDPELIEASLNVRYKKDPAFRHIWDNRHRHPAALQNALKVIANDLGAKYNVRRDPQIAENVRAAKSSQQSMATQRPANDNGVPTDPREFSKYWNRLVNGG